MICLLACGIVAVCWCIMLSLFKALYGKKRTISHVRPCFKPSYLHVLLETREPGTKLLDQAKKAYFVSFETNKETSGVFFAGTCRCKRQSPRQHQAM